MSSTDFKMTTEKKILKKKIIKKKILKVKKKKENVNGFWYYNKFDNIFPEGSKSTNNNPDGTKRNDDDDRTTETDRDFPPC